METELTFIEKVAAVQNELKAPKDKTASVKTRTGTNYSYKFRNAETILSDVKPLLLKHSLVITLDDKLISMEGRLFIESKATIFASESEGISATAIAELLKADQMNAPQASGATSSYARKYALCGVLGIDDGDDADDPKYIQRDPEFHTTYMNASAKTLSGKATEKQIGLIEAKTNGMKAGNPAAYKEFGEWYKKELDNLPFKALTKAQASKVIDQLQPKEEETF